jgi:molecular chaperone GrpE (heat shock protein)
VLDENRMLEATTNELLAVKSRVENAATSSGDNKLMDICKAVTEVASKLLAALDRLKVGSAKSK